MHSFATFSKPLNLQTFLNVHFPHDSHRCLESSFLELSQQSQVALSNAAAQVTSSLPHGLPTGPSGNINSGGGGGGGNNRYGASNAPRNNAGYAANNTGGGIASGRHSARHSASSSNLPSMAGNQAAGQNSQPPAHNNGRGYNSVGTNLNALGGTSYAGGNPYTNMYANNAQGQTQSQSQGQGQSYYNSESNQYGSAAYNTTSGGYNSGSSGNSARYNNYTGGGYGGNY